MTGSTCPPSREADRILSGGHGARALLPTLRRDHGGPPRQRERYSKASDKKPGALSQTLNQLWSACEICAGGGRSRGHHDVGKSVERHRDQAERHELQRCVAGRRFDELRNECEKESRALEFRRLSRLAVPKRPRISDRTLS